MPRNVKRTFRKKSTRRVRRKPTRSTKRLPGPFHSAVGADPFRQTMRTKMHYSANHTMATGIGGAFGSEFVYRCNSLFDPFFNVGGHQPYAFDQMAVLYKKYKVTGFLMELHYTDPSEDGLVVGVTVQPPGGVAQLQNQPIETIREQPMSVTRSINNSGKQTGLIKQFFPISTISGLTKLQFQADVDTFTAVVANNPIATPFVRFALGSDRGTATGSLIMKVKFTYYATFYERTTQSAST